MEGIINKLAKMEPLSQAQLTALMALKPFMKNITLKKGALSLSKRGYS